MYGWKFTTKLEDHLGSTDVLLTSLWNGSAFVHESTEYQAYDPWGERANPQSASPYRQNDSDPFRRSAQDYDRGYTGHQMLDDSGLIHMNGRLYDAELGRMLSPDPYVQVPEYSQNFNRYSYVLNNPLNKTDPTGYSWLSKAFHKIGSWIKENWRTVVAIVLCVIFFYVAPLIVGSVLGATGAVFTPAVTQAMIGATSGFLSGAANAALAGGDLGDVLRGAAVGAVQGAISSGPLHSIESATTYGGKAAHVVGHGVTGGAANAAMGGKFQDGFLSAAAGAAATHTGLYGKFEGAGAHNIARRTAVAGMIGGTASALGGGKFANGAWTAAFQHLLNYESPKFLEDQAVAAGLLWVKGGNAGKTYVLDGTTQMGKDLLKFPEVNQSMQDAYSNQGATQEWRRDLGKEAPLTYVKSFAKDFFGNNRTRALHGSIRGTTIFKDGTFYVRANDTLGWVSFTHEPVTVSRALQLDKIGLFTGNTYANNYLIGNNKFGADGVGGNVSIHYNLKIKVY